MDWRCSVATGKEPIRENKESIWHVAFAIDRRMFTIGSRLLNCRTKRSARSNRGAVLWLGLCPARIRWAGRLARASS